MLPRLTLLVAIGVMASNELRQQIEEADALFVGWAFEPCRGAPVRSSPNIATTEGLAGLLGPLTLIALVPRRSRWGRQTK